MPETYQTVFDITARPEQIHPDYGFCILSLLAAATFMWLAWRRSRIERGKINWLGLFVAAALVISLVAVAGKDMQEAFDTRDRLKHHDYQTVEGCLVYFHPGLLSARRGVPVNEYWAVGGQLFNYPGGNLEPGYNRVEPDDGFIHADTQVRVAYLPGGYSWGNEIVRLEVIQHACPAANDPEPRSP